MELQARISLYDTVLFFFFLRKLREGVIIAF